MKPRLILGPLLAACAPADEATWRTDTTAVDTDTEINELEEDDEGDIVRVPMTNKEWHAYISQLTATDENPTPHIPVEEA